MNLSRYALTPQPAPGGQPGKLEEARAQWFLELAFFRDVVLRNHPSKGGHGELANTVVLHSDVALMTQIKAQSSSRSPQVWAKKEIGKALRQLGHTNRMLAEGGVTSVHSELLGDLPVDPLRYTKRWGLIVLDQRADPFDPVDLVPEITNAPFPVQVYSLADLEMLTTRFDTAGDFINYIEMRDAFRSRLRPRVHDEQVTLAQVVAHSEDYFAHFCPELSGEDLKRTLEMIRRTADGEFQRSPYVGYGLAYDDLIARLHDRDPDLPYNQGTGASHVLPVLEELSWLTRVRRVVLGRKIATLADHARDGKPRFFHHFQRRRSIVFVYLSTKLPRLQRVEFLGALTQLGQAKYDCEKALGVATEPVGSGRSYDLAYSPNRLSSKHLRFLRAQDDPFGDASTQLTDSLSLDL